MESFQLKFFKNKKTKTPKNQKQPNEKQAGMDGSQNITLSFSFSPPSTLSCHLSLSHLSVCPLPVCLPVQVILSYRGKKENVSHPEWLSVRRDLPSEHISSRQTDTE